MKFERSQVLWLIVAMEAVLAAFAYIWAGFARIDLTSFLSHSPQPVADLIIIGLVFGLALSGLSIALSTLGVKYGLFKGMNDLIRNVLVPLFKEARLSDIVIIALASGFAEELFFRGVLQTQFGIIVASLVFALVHFAGPRFIAYTLFAFGAGLFMGVLFDSYDSLWVPIAAHAANNFLSISAVRYRYAQQTPEA